MFWIYTNMAILAAAAAIVFTARLNSATPKAGQNFEMDAIAAGYREGSRREQGRPVTHLPQTSARPRDS
jgi:putative multiple sugar transport system permease protein